MSWLKASGKLLVSGLASGKLGVRRNTEPGALINSHRLCVVYSHPHHFSQSAGPFFRASPGPRKEKKAVRRLKKESSPLA
jgi:hypothetical protein